MGEDTHRLVLHWIHAPCLCLTSTVCQCTLRRLARAPALLAHLGAGGAGNVAGEGLHVWHQLGPALSCSCTAHTLAEGDAQAAQAPLVRADDELPLRLPLLLLDMLRLLCCRRCCWCRCTVEARPVEVGKGGMQLAGHGGHGSHPVGLACETGEAGAGGCGVAVAVASTRGSEVHTGTSITHERPRLPSSSSCRRSRTASYCAARCSLLAPPASGGSGAASTMVHGRLCGGAGQLQPSIAGRCGSQLRPWGCEGAGRSAS